MSFTSRGLIPAAVVLSICVTSVATLPLACSSAVETPKRRPGEQPPQLAEGDEGAATLPDAPAILANPSAQHEDTHIVTTSGQTVDEAMTELVESVKREVLDRGWARDAEVKVAHALQNVSGVTLQTVQCASTRCVAEATTASRKDYVFLVRGLENIEGLPRGRIRRTSGEGRSHNVKVVLAREGYNVNGEASPRREATD